MDKGSHPPCGWPPPEVCLGVGDGDYGSMGHVSSSSRLPFRVHVSPSAFRHSSKDCLTSGGRQEGGPLEGVGGASNQECSGKDSRFTPPMVFLHVFLTPKKSGLWRPILNLKPLNAFMHPPPFRMETLKAILPTLRRVSWGATLDLKDAYLHIPMHQSARQWLRFFLNGAAYEFKVLPFGLSTAPRTFTRVVKTLAEFLRCNGIKIYIYLDDWLVVAPSFELLQRDLITVFALTTRLGFIINHEKSSLIPS